jgi:hypothetical protein
MKTLATLTAASMMALAGVAAAQQPTPTPSTPPATPTPPPANPQANDQAQRGPGMNRADFNSLTDAWIAAIQAGLKLNPEQQRLWGPVEDALRAQAAARAERFEQHRRMMAERRDDRGSPDRDLDIPQRLEQRAERASRFARMVTERAQRATALANAMRPFYDSLDENQKRLLPVLLRQGNEVARHMYRGEHGRWGGMGGRMHHWGMMGRGDMGRGMMGRDDDDRGRGMMGRDRDGMNRPWWNRDDGMDRDRGDMGRGMMDRDRYR